MFEHLEIYTPGERRLVGLADAALSVAAWPERLLRRRRGAAPGRVLLLRLERIGDLLMTLGAIRAVRLLAPAADIDLVVGSWNEGIARLIPEVTRVETLDLPWLSRGGGGAAPTDLLRRAGRWRERRYDLAINFEGDIRSHLLLRASGARRRVGFGHAGGGPLLTDVVRHDAGRHVADNSMALVERAFDRPPGDVPGRSTTQGADLWRLSPPAAAQGAALAVAQQLAGSGSVLERPWIAVHAPGGRQVKQWPVERFAEAAATLARQMGATVVLTGGPGDEAVVSTVAAQLAAGGIATVAVPAKVDLVILAALLERCRLLLTGDTGPMHMAAAVGTPVVAVFGPSMPWRYGPLVEPHRIVRVDLPCSPCNRIRRPPLRCQGCVPDCLDAVNVAAVVDAAVDVMTRAERAAGVPAR